MSELTENTQSRVAAVRRVMLIVLWLNLIVAVAKAIYAAWSGSLAVGTDAMHSFLDAGANVLGLIALRYAAEPPDSGHPYGHRKFEILAAAAIGVMIAVGVIEFGVSAVTAILEGHAAAETPSVGFVVVGATWLMNMFVATYEARKAKQLNSELLLADASHTASDVVVTAAVLVSLAAARYGVKWADAVGALLVLAFVARVAFGILRANISILVDSAVVDADEVRAVAVGTTGVRDCHRVRSRGTASSAQLDLHLILDPEISLYHAHEIAHAVEDSLRSRFMEIADVTIHMEPEGDAEEEL